MPFADLALARRLEAAEAYSCEQFARSRKRLIPSCTSEWTTIGGATVVFDGVDSPITQTFGLGLFQPLTAEILEETEAWFRARNAPVQHEVCPLAGIEALSLLCARGYRPIEVASVLHQTVTHQTGTHQTRTAPSGAVSAHDVRQISPEEAALWSDISAAAWSQDHPEYAPMLRDFGLITASRDQDPCFLAYAGDQPAAAGALVIHQGVALFIGAATLPEFRRRGLQSALLAERLRHAHANGCDLAMMAAEAGGESQRNAERNGFRIAYTRIKWKLTEAQRSTA